MMYRVNASSTAGAISVSASSLEEAQAKADELKAKDYTNIVIINAGTGEPLKKGGTRDA
jgi:hypothetical protein